MDDVVARIMDSNNWPNIELPENLELLNELADESFSEQPFSGMLAAALMYHQLIEAMCLHLLDNCRFFIQLSIYPATIQYAIPQNKMLGSYVSALRENVSFPNKNVFLDKVMAFNAFRNEVIHGMRRNNLEEISDSMRNVKSKFDEIYDLYNEIADYFRVAFHGFKKDTFLDEYASDV